MRRKMSWYKRAVRKREAEDQGITARELNEEKLRQKLRDEVVAEQQLRRIFWEERARQQLASGARRDLKTGEVTAFSSYATYMGTAYPNTMMVSTFDARRIRELMPLPPQKPESTSSTLEPVLTDPPPLRPQRQFE
jgi:trans-2-enoyl-CoA reductase